MGDTTLTAPPTQTYSSIATRFLQIVGGTGVAVATGAALLNPIGGAVLGALGLMALGTAAYQALGSADEVTQKRLAERSQILVDLAKTADPPGAIPAETAAIEKLRTDVRDLLPPDPTAMDVDAARLALGRVTTRIDETKKIVAARQATQSKLGAAQTLLAGTLKVVTQDVRAVLEQQLAAIRTDSTKAATVSDYQGVDGKLLLFTPVVNAAAAYGKREVFLSAMVETCKAAGADETELKNKLTEADGLAKAGKFAEAEVKLDEFEAVPTAGGTAGSSSANHIAFQKAIQAYRASPGASSTGKMKENHCKNLFVGVEKYRDDFTKALKDVKDGTKTADQGRLIVEALTAELGAFYPVYQKYIELKQCIDSLGPLLNAGPAAQLPLAATVWSLAVPAPALPVLQTGLDLDVAKYGAALAAVKASYDLLSQGGAGSAHLVSLYNAARAKANPPTTTDYAGAVTDLGAMDKVMRDIAAYRSAKGQFDIAAGGLDPVLAAAIEKPSADAVLAADWSTLDIPTLIRGEAEQAGEAALYAARLAEATLARGVADDTGKPVFDEWLKRADAEAKKMKFADGRAILDELTRIDGVSQIDADAARWIKVRDAAVAGVADATKALGGGTAAAKGAAVLARALLDGRALFETTKDEDKDLGAATAALSALATSNADAIAVGREQPGLLTLKTALVAVDPTKWTPTEDKALVDIDALIEGGKFEDALKAVRALRGALKVAAAAAANTLEATDHGHSLEAHGPDAINPPVIGGEDPQVTRVKTGFRRGTTTHRSPSTKPTTFESEADWLIARQAALDKVVAFIGVPLTPLTVGRATPPPRGTRGRSVQVIIEHGRPIDRAVIGVREDMAMKDGEVQEGDTSQTFETWTGLTRTLSTLEYYEDGPGALTGHWKLAQQFPYAVDWDNVKQCYTKPVPAIK